MGRNQKEATLNSNDISWILFFLDNVDFEKMDQNDPHVEEQAAHAKWKRNQMVKDLSEILEDINNR